MNQKGLKIIIKNDGDIIFEPIGQIGTECDKYKSLEEVMINITSSENKDEYYNNEININNTQLNNI